MLEASEVLKFHVEGQAFQHVKKMARLAEVGGGSPIRDGDDERHGSITRDQVVGQLGQYALCMYWYGCADAYDVARKKANENRHRGDGGSDIPGLNLDVKSSYMKHAQDPMLYRLPVKPQERHAGWVYVLAMVSMRVLEMATEADVFLVGWAKDSMFDVEPEHGGVFDGSYTLMAHRLNALPPVDWQLLRTSGKVE